MTADTAIVLWIDLQEVRTEAVFQTSEPVFNRSWTFVAPSYDSIVSIDLVDAANDRPVGRFETSVIVLLQVRCRSSQ